MELTPAAPSVWARLTGRAGRRPALRAFGASAIVAIGSLVPALQECTPSSQQQQVVDLTNQRRASAGVPGVRVNGALSTAAQRHSQDQAGRNRMSHTGSDGSGPGTRIARTGYQACAWAENVAAGQPDAQRVMQSWMNSPDHRANIVSRNYTEIGVGLAYSSGGTPYWTMVLARPC
jgi:uncharacterized protein YkwD